MNSIVNSARERLGGALFTSKEQGTLRERVRLDVVLALIILGFGFVLYLRTMPPTVLDSDSGEYQYMAYILGVPHSTGYPLYILLGKLFTFLPAGDVAYRINLSSVVFAALTGPLVFWTARRLGLPRLPALLATLILGVTPSMWGGAVFGKSYALHLFLGVLTLYLAMRWHQEGRARDFYWLALVCGLGLTNHIIYRFIAPGLLILLWFNRSRLNRTIVARGVLLLVVPLLLYAYIPIRANQLIAQQDPANKALYGREDAMLKGTVTAYYNNSPEGLFKFITGLDNSYKLDVKSPLDSVNRVDLSVSLLFQQFGVAGLVFAIAGMYIAFRRDWRLSIVLVAAAGGVGIVAFYLHGISTVYYFAIPYFVLALWIGYGIDGLLRLLRGWASSLTRPKLPSEALVPAVGALLFLMPASGLVGNFQAMDQSGDYTARDNAQEILDENLPQNAVVAAPWEVSQPLRYFQFVENKRPDLLVINLSPIGMSEKQFNVIIKNALSLKRPFYLVEFNPELRTDPGPRSVQAIPLPMLQPHQPQYSVKKPSLLPQVEVLGYDLGPEPPQPDKPTRVWVYYRASQRMYPMYSAMLSISDVRGRPVMDIPGFPVSYNFPTYRWYELGEYFRDGWTIHWPAGTQEGLYNLDLKWYPYDLETHKPDFDHETRVTLGTIRVGNLTAEVVPHAVDVAMADGLTFRGWTSSSPLQNDVLAAERGKPLDLELFWNTDQPLSTAYTVFVHLIDSTGRVITDADSPPMSGLFPTDRWVLGETVRDPHTLKIPSDLASGDYAIEVGMYLAATGKRLSVQGPPGNTDRIILTRVHVK